MFPINPCAQEGRSGLDSVTNHISILCKLTPHRRPSSAVCKQLASCLSTPGNMGPTSHHTSWEAHFSSNCPTGFTVTIFLSPSGTTYDK